MKPIQGTLMLTLDNGSAIYTCDAAGTVASGISKDGNAKIIGYSAGSLMLVDKNGETIVGPVDSEAALYLAIGVASGDSRALTEPQASHVMASVNKVILVGNLGADPEIRRTQDGRPIANMRIATSEQWRDKNSGERREKTEWHSVVVFNEGLCKVVEQYIKKGAKVYIEGQLQTRKWTDQQGHDRYSTEIVLQGFSASLVMLDKSQGSGYQAGGNGPEDYDMDPERAAGRSSSSSTSSRPAPSFSRDMGDDIPF
jgi:single-strand DNA-binding protein